MKPSFQLTLLSHLGRGAVLYGLEYPGVLGCPSWCYLTIAKGVVIATQPETDCGTSITNSWSKEFFGALSELSPIKEAGQGTHRLRWFEHYHRADPTLDEVLLAEGGTKVTWRFYALDKDVERAFEQLTGEPIPDFASTGYEEQRIESIRSARDLRRL
jgi:hypothetical protein